MKAEIWEDCNSLEITEDPEELGNELVDEFLSKIDEIISKKEQAH
ncbi:hypothetical protein [Methanobacterium sp. ACI-7]